MTDTLDALLRGELPPKLYRCASRARPETITRLAAAHGWRVYRLEGREIGGKADLLNRSAAALRFPAYFGHNWDAFEECLNDMSWEPPGPALLLFDHAGRFAAAEPEQFAMALEILAAAVANRQDGPAPLAVLVRGGGRATAHLPALKGEKCLGKSGLS